MSAPAALLNQSPVIARLTRFPAPLIAKTATANHQAHRLRRRTPAPEQNVPIERSMSARATIVLCPRKTRWAGLFNSHNRSDNGLGTINDTPTISAIPVAAKRNTARTGIVAGRCGSFPEPRIGDADALTKLLHNVRQCLAAGANPRFGQSGQRLLNHVQP